jgi:hypothetical protein
MTMKHEERFLANKMNKKQQKGSTPNRSPQAEILFEWV